jgi:hypothetical protein
MRRIGIEYSGFGKDFIGALKDAGFDIVDVESKRVSIIYDSRSYECRNWGLPQGRLEKISFSTGVVLIVSTSDGAKRLLEFADSYEPKSSCAHNSSQAEACSPRSP